MQFISIKGNLGFLKLQATNHKSHSNRSSAGIPSLPGALPSCVELIAAIGSLRFRDSSRLDATGHCTMASLVSSARSPVLF